MAPAVRTTNPVAYEEACAAADGDDVKEIEAAAVCPDMIVWHGGRWLRVMYRRLNGDAVILDFAVPEPGCTAYRMVDSHTPMLRRIAAAGAGR